MTDLPLKHCSGCDRDLPIDAFGKRTVARDGLQIRCKVCTSAYVRRLYAERYSAKQRSQHFFRKYGLTLAERDALIAEQGGRCAICGTENGDARWNTFSVDHSHDTDRVRGMLCSHCNRGLGHFLDDPDRLLAAAAYLLQHSDVLGQCVAKGEPA